MAGLCFVTVGLQSTYTINHATYCKTRAEDQPTHGTVTQNNRGPPSLSFSYFSRLRLVQDYNLASVSRQRFVHTAFAVAP